jgi:hypothetical protein
MTYLRLAAEAFGWFSASLWAWYFAFGLCSRAERRRDYLWLAEKYRDGQEVVR